jgi:hypothetical protein
MRPVSGILSSGIHFFKSKNYLVVTYISATVNALPLPTSDRVCI